MQPETSPQTVPCSPTPYNTQGFQASRQGTPRIRARPLHQTLPLPGAARSYLVLCPQLDYRSGSCSESFPVHIGQLCSRADQLNEVLRASLAVHYHSTITGVLLSRCYDERAKVVERGSQLLLTTRPGAVKLGWAGLGWGVPPCSKSRCNHGWKIRRRERQRTSRHNLWSVGGRVSENRLRIETETINQLATLHVAYSTRSHFGGCDSRD